MKTLFLALQAVVLVCHAQDAFFVGIATNRYEIDTWPRQPYLPGCVSDFRPILPEPVLEQYTISTNEDYEATFSSYRLTGVHSDEHAMFRLRISRRENFEICRRILLETLGGMQSTVPMPRGTNGLEKLGDICFAQLSLPSHVLFIRNNVFVSCYSSSGYDTMTNLLFSLDNQVVDSLRTNSMDTLTMPAAKTGDEMVVPLGGMAFDACAGHALGDLSQAEYLDVWVDKSTPDEENLTKFQHVRGVIGKKAGDEGNVDTDGFPIKLE